MGSAAFAKAELQSAGFFDADSDYNGGIGKAVMELMEVFEKQGHSGGSAPMVASLFAKVATYQPIRPIQGTDDEWVEVAEEDGKPLFQNKRCSAMFKVGKDGEAYYLDAIVWRTPHGGAYCGTASGIRSHQFVKEFPFVPKTFYIDVDEKEIAKDDWVFTVKDELDLHPVEVYYNFQRELVTA